MRQSGASGRKRAKTPKPSKKPVHPRKLKRGKPSKPVSILANKKVADKLIKQLKDRKGALQRKRAEQAIKRFRVRKEDRGKIVFVETTGKRDTGKGRKGYMVYIGKRGKKQLVADVKKGLQPQQKSKLTSPYTKKTAKQTTDFVKARATDTLRGSGQVRIKGANDFSDKVVDRFASGVLKVINAQRGFRDFLLKAMILVRLEDGSTRTYEVLTAIQKPGQIEIPKEHIFNFIRQEFYALMARQLAFDGYVTNGSANHVRRLKENKGKEREEWTKGGLAWFGREDTEDVKILQIDWQMYQNKVGTTKRKGKRK